MAAALFVGLQKDFLFSRTVTQLPGPQLRGKILMAYETIKKVRDLIVLRRLLTFLDRVCGTLDVVHVVGLDQSELLTVLQSRLCLRQVALLRPSKSDHQLHDRHRNSLGPRVQPHVAERVSGRFSRALEHDDDERVDCEMHQYILDDVGFVHLRLHH